MSVAQLVYQGHNNLRYKVTITGEEGGEVVITSTGAATPDLITDTLAGPLWEIARANLNGIGTVAAGALTQADARDILQADDSGASVGNAKVPRARLQLAPRDAIGFFVDVGVDGGGNPTITVQGDQAGTTYLDVEFIGGIGA